MRGKAFGETIQTVGSSYAAGYIELSRKRHQAPWRVERTAISMGHYVPLLEFNQLEREAAIFHPGVRRWQHHDSAYNLHQMIAAASKSKTPPFDGQHRGTRLC